jgi:hypothetical protein
MPQRERISPLIYSCCLLHNLIINRQEVVNPDLFRDVTSHPPGYEGVAAATREAHKGGEIMRENLWKEVFMLKGLHRE